MIWIFWLFIVGPFACDLVVGQGQRIAPGVPPQHYQQPQGQYQQQVHHQHVPQQPPPHHQPQQQYQQPPVHQQVPIQQQQVPHQQQQQVPHQQQTHGHDHAHHQSQQILNAANIAHEKEHIAEHFNVPIDTAKMSDQELQFHYFKMHDADNNNKLDGCELIKSLIHWHEQGSKDPAHGATAGDKLFKDEELGALIDPILLMDDSNYDGFIDYTEFIKAQEKAAANNRQQSN